MGISLLLTEISELITAMIFRLRGRDILLMFAANLMTNPAVNAAFYILSGESAISDAAIKAALEISAVLAEYFIYRRFGEAVKKPFRFSLCANAFSFFAGMAVNVIFLEVTK